MKTGLTNGLYRHYYGDSAFVKMREHGYSCVDFQDLIDTDNEYYTSDDVQLRALLKTQRDMITGAGLEISQTHGPWRFPPQDATPEDRAERLEKMKHALRCTSLLGCRNMVVHPIMPFGCDREPDSRAMHDLNLEYFRKLTEAAHDFGVTICLENMPMPAISLATPKQILDFVREIDDPLMRVCLDTGHCAVTKVEPADAVRTLGSYLRVMHVHDNNGRSDQHYPPYTGVIDWPAFTAALRETGFDGTVSLESSLSGKFPPSVAEYMLRGMAEMAGCVAGNVEKGK